MVGFDVGRKLKELREKKRFTIRELSRRSGVSTTQISEIERNLSAPTVPTLMRIISSLDTHASIFFEEKEERKVCVVRKSNRQEFIDRKNNVFVESLTEGITGTNLKVIVARPPPGSINIRGGYVHRGEELIYVIKGRIRVTLGEEEYILDEGDTIHFRGMIRHTIANITDREVELISVTAPPNY
jgi:transcriptional regulator with XRE-family HTH domain